MKILFLCEYFFPFDRGGSEWSIYHLAKSLVNQGHNVCVFTPNFGALSQENLEGITIYRFPYYLKLKKPHQVVVCCTSADKVSSFCKTSYLPPYCYT